MSHIHRCWLSSALLATAAFTAGGSGTAQAVAGAEDAAVARDRALYAGRWKIVAIEADGEAKPADAREVIVVNRADGTWAMSVDGLEVNRGESRMDPLAVPPEIDVEITSGDGKGKVLRGIYEVSETRRRLCFRGGQGWRPSEFRAQSGDGAVLVTFEKVPDVSGP